VSVPLLFFSQSGKTKASHYDYEISQQNYRQKSLEVNAAYRDLCNRYQSMTEVLQYYRNEALPLAERQMKATTLGYRLGSLDYIQFIQNMSAAIKTKQEYVNRLAEFYEIEDQLNFLVGQ
jgi:cobalt-zinc-cadmium resistance protein CzcA